MALESTDKAPGEPELTRIGDGRYAVTEGANRLGDVLGGYGVWCGYTRSGEFAGRSKTRKGAAKLIQNATRS